MIAVLVAYKERQKQRGWVGMRGHKEREREKEKRVKVSPFMTKTDLPFAVAQLTRCQGHRRDHKATTTIDRQQENRSGGGRQHCRDSPSSRYIGLLLRRQQRFFTTTTSQKRRFPNKGHAIWQGTDPFSSVGLCTPRYSFICAER